MSSLKPTDILILEKLFEMGDGYVLNFSNASFQRFILDVCNIDIYDSKYAVYGESKANRLRRFWPVESDKTVGILINEMLTYWKTNREINAIKINENEAQIFNNCLKIANRLRGVTDKANLIDSSDITEEEFLKKEYENITLEKLNIDSCQVSQGCL